MPIFCVKSVKIYTGQKKIYTGASRDKYEVCLIMEYLQSIYWALTFRGQKIMNQVLYDCDRYKTARCSCSMQPIINWTQWKWSRQFSGRRNLSNCKSIPAPPQTAAWPAVGIKRNAGSIPRRQLQTEILSQLVLSPWRIMQWPWSFPSTS